MMSVVVETNQKERYVIAKGAPDVLMNRSSHIMHGGRTASFQRLTGKKQKLRFKGWQDRRLEPLPFRIKSRSDRKNHLYKAG